jgi:nucleotide-binding universal stress UspA family protein
MIKSILVALDGSPSSNSAKKMAILMAKDFNATLSGIGILDEPWIAAPEAIPLGGATFKVELDEQLLADAKRHVHKLETSFLDFCRNHDVSCSVIDATGVPSYEIEHFMVEHDLLIIGKDADFHFNPTQSTAVPVRQLLKDNPRPIIVTSTELPHEQSKHILVAFDGTFAASRALHMGLLLGLFEGKTVHIANVSQSEEEARDKVNMGAKLCKNHGVIAHIYPLVSQEKPEKALLNLSEDIKPSLIIMGVYGHGTLSHLFWGSCADNLLKSTLIPIFFYH